jgi:hypothetical protein
MGSGKLQVDRSELKEALKNLLRHTARSKRGEAILTFSDGNLEISCGGMTVTVAATGTWSGAARLSGEGLIGLWNRMPNQDPLIATWEEGRCHLASLSLPCHAGCSDIELSMNVSPAEIVALPHFFSSEQIRDSGLEQLVLQEEEKLSKTIERALVPLKRYGITREDLIDLIVRQGGDLYKK